MANRTRLSLLVLLLCAALSVFGCSGSEDDGGNGGNGGGGGGGGADCTAACDNLSELCDFGDDAYQMCLDGCANTTAAQRECMENLETCDAQTCQDA